MRSIDSVLAWIARGKWPAAAVRARLDPRPFALGARLAARVARTWAREVARARAERRRLFAGPVAGLVRVEASSEEELALVLRATDYRALVGTNLSPGYVALPRERAPRADALGLTVVPRAKGGALVLQRRSRWTYECPGALDFAGGHVEAVTDAVPGPGARDRFPRRLRSSTARGAPCPVRAALRELEEELGVAPSAVIEVAALGLARVRATEKPQLLLVARLGLGAEEVRERARSASDGFEREPDLVLVEGDRRSLRKLLARRDLAPGARAAIELLVSPPGGSRGP